MADEVRTVEERRVTGGRFGYFYGESPIARLIWFLGGLTVAILLIRFIFSLLGANHVGFAGFIYTISQPLVAPFYGMFSYNSYNYGQSHFEVYTVVAMVVYLLATWAAAALVSIPSGRRTYA